MRQVTIKGNTLHILSLVMRHPGITHRELGRECNLPSVASYLSRLRRLGLVTWDDSKVRTLRATCQVFRPKETS